MGIGLENPVHLLMLALVVLLVFGPKRLPEVGRSLGRGIREFRTSLTPASTRPLDRQSAPDDAEPGDERPSREEGAASVADPSRTND